MSVFSLARYPDLWIRDEEGSYLGLSTRVVSRDADEFLELSFGHGNTEADVMHLVKASGDVETYFLACRMGRFRTAGRFVEQTKASRRARGLEQELRGVSTGKGSWKGSPLSLEDCSSRCVRVCIRQRRKRRL